jgi:hypothetical protein
MALSTMLLRLAFVLNLAFVCTVQAQPHSAVDETSWHNFSTSPDWNEPPPAKSAQKASPAVAGAGPIVPAARQPSGALSGRVVFMNSGHGWTWDISNKVWYLQRPAALNSMNEDYGNWDQLNFFAAYCFNAGAVVASMRPLGQQTNEVVIDNVDAGVTFAGTWSNGTSTVYFGKPGDVPYRYAALDNTESATATYTPSFPATGYYPVYTWARWGSDRGDQLYRVRHTGGESQIRIPHYLVGNGWLYLGEYYFNAGSNAADGSVVISNLRGSTNGSVVVADAIRFGNGMGSIDRGGGVSGYPREEESCRYWVQYNLGQGQSTSIYNIPGDTDEQESWHVPPRMSIEMTRTNGTSFFSRIHISFHSNASTGNPTTATLRGDEALITSVPTPNQAALAQICGQTVNDEMVSLGSPPLEFAWNDNGTNTTYSGGYSEISNNDFVSEMDATIIEVAYHDNTTDAALMCDSKVRAALARAMMHAVVKYMNRFDTNNPVPLIFLPEPPSNVRAIGNTNGAIALAWSAPISVANSGAPTNYIVYQSTNGYGFGNPVSVGTATNLTITNLPAGIDYYFRISAANAGGESFPSEVVGCRTPVSSTSPKVLFVNGFDRFDRTTDLKQDFVPQHYVPPSGSGGNDRVLPRRVNSFGYVVSHGKALSASGVAFDSCRHSAVTNGLVALTNYPIVLWACGNQSTADVTFNAIEQGQVTAFLSGGGNLFASGSEIAWDLDRPSGPTIGDRSFLHNQLHGAYVADSSGVWNFNAVANSIFSGSPNGTFDDGSQGIYLVGYPDLLAPTNGATASVNYSSLTTGAAGIVYNGAGGGGKVVYFGFPFETITSVDVRNACMADVLSFFGANPLRFDSITLLPGSQVKLALQGATGTYTLLTGPALNTLGALALLTNTTGTFAYIDAATNSGPTFYRVRQP